MKQTWRLEYLDPVVFPITHGHVSIGQDREPLKTLELSVITAVTPEHAVKPAVTSKHLDPVVSTVGHYDESLVIDADAFGVLHLTLHGSDRPEMEDIVTVH